MNCNRHNSRRRSRRLQTRTAGFTLVEMLVAVALVLLLMSMFAQVFQIAGSTMSKQRGIAENDQRSRTLQNIIKGDLDKRTFRLVVPWVNQENGQLPEADGPLRRGYLYISENDPASETDDFLQLTVSANVITKQKDFEPFTGKATLVGSQGLADPTDQGQRNRLLYDEPNQPEADDGRTTLEDGTATSSAAEIAYFLRNGNLYRRVLLIREPLPSVGAADSQPRFKANNNTLWDAFDYTTSPDPGVPPSYPATGNFWNDFDFSAFPMPCEAPNDNLGKARFHGVADLNNAAEPGNPESNHFGKPQRRFGFHAGFPVPTASANAASRIEAIGRSREWDILGANPTAFIGRLTHEETSHSSFAYPHGFAGGDPMQANLAVDPATGVVGVLANGPRRGEDLLLSNVHAFDIKVWDDFANQFVDIGGPDSSYYGADTASGSLRAYRIRHNGQSYGPTLNNDSINNVFDTWHPDVDLDLNADNTISSSEQNLQPPYRLRLYVPDVDNDSTPDFFPFSINGSTDRTRPSWAANASLQIGELRFPSVASLQASTRFYYRMVGTATGATGPNYTTGGTEPAWPTSAGVRVIDNECVWEAVDNWRPLKAIQITVRFFDIPSDQMRQVTIVHNLVD